MRMKILGSVTTGIISQVRSNGAIRPNAAVDWGHTGGPEFDAQARDALAIPIRQAGRFAMKSPLSLAALVALAGLVGAGSVSAGSLHWLAPVADCYDTAVAQKRSVVVIFYDPVSSRLDADKMSMRLAMSPRMQALSDVTVWCMGDVTRDVVARNMAKALGIAEYPTLSVLAPNPNMLDETVRIVGFKGAFAENHLEGAQDHIIRGVSKVQTGQAADRAKDARPPAASSAKR